MILHQKIELATSAEVGGPTILPLELQGLDDASLADLDWVDEALGFQGFGFLPVEVPEPRPSPFRLPKIDFWRLFTPDEEDKFNRARRQVAALTDADYDDPAKAGLVALERLLNRLDSTSIVEVDHPETHQGVDLMVFLEILAPERADAVKAGEQP